MSEQSVLRRRAVFFDRDGVINEDLGYVHMPEQFRFLPGAPDAIRWLNQHGWLAIVATNQSGIGRGLYSEEDFLRLTRWIDQRLAEFGAHLDATYYCPHHPTEAQLPYRIDCQCRKPAPGMILRAIAEWQIDPARSLLIGNSQRDLLAAEAAGVRGVLFEGGNLLECVLRACQGTLANEAPPQA
jgi:D-glycero-D-manno-heptose 1,7-bisphosphate phosphatase